MSDEGIGMTETWQKVAMGVGVAAVVMLITANILLWQLLQKDQNATEPQNQSAALPSLPASSGKSTSKELLRELNKTQRQLKTPLGQTVGQLQVIGNSTATLAELPALLQSLLASVNDLSAAAPELRSMAKQVKSMNKQLKSTTALLGGLGPVLVDLEKTLNEIKQDTTRIRQCTEKPSSCG